MCEQRLKNLHFLIDLAEWGNPQNRICILHGFGFRKPGVARYFRP
jgi:hypothetical protein